MRLPLVTPLKSRNGTANKDGRMTNVLQETRGGRQLATVRPGLSTVVTASGSGNGLVSFNNKLISVYGANVYQGSSLTVTSNTLDTQEVFSGTVFGGTSALAYMLIENSVSSTAIYTTDGTTISYIGDADLTGGNPDISASAYPSYYDSQTGYWYAAGDYFDGIDTYGVVLRSADALTYTPTITTTISAYMPSTGAPIFEFGTKLFGVANISAGTLDISESNDGGLTWGFSSSTPIPLCSGDILGMAKVNGTFCLFGAGVFGNVVAITTENGTSFTGREIPVLTDSTVGFGFVFANNRYYFRVFDGTDINTYAADSLSTDSADYELISTVAQSDNPSAPLGNLVYIASTNVMVGPYLGVGTYPDYPIECEVFTFVPPSSGTVTDSFFDFVESTT